MSRYKDADGNPVPWYQFTDNEKDRALSDKGEIVIRLFLTFLGLSLVVAGLKIMALSMNG